MNKEITWFTDRIGAEVLRNNRVITINNDKEANYHYKLQTHFKYQDPVKVHSVPESTCLACEG